MQRVRLGVSDIEISQVGLGCWQFSEGKGLVGGYWPALADPVITEIVQASLDQGVNWFDTAEAYGDGASERALARALQGCGVAPGAAIVATKWLPLPYRAASSIGETAATRRACLAPYPIDLHQVHQPFGSLSTHAGQMQAMAALVAEQKVKTVGISNFSASAMRTCHGVLAEHGIPLVSNQVRYSLSDRSIEHNGVLDAARQLGVTLIAYSPLAQGVLTGRFHDDPTKLLQAGLRRFRPDFSRRNLDRLRPLIEALKRIASGYDATPAQVALRWLVQHGDGTVVVIPGASRAAQARSNAAAMDFDLSVAEQHEIDRLSR
jgi:aryl-alcohol dehydrogenase-like predicted oxidoreductase